MGRTDADFIVVQAEATQEVVAGSSVDDHITLPDVFLLLDSLEYP